MSKSLVVVIAIGLGIGLLIPTGETSRAGEPADGAAAATSGASARSPVEREPRPAVATRLQRASSGHFYAEATVNDTPIEFIVDTGATTVALSIADAQRAGIAVDPSGFEVVGSGASGPVRGQEIKIDRIDLDGKEVRDLRALVLEGLGVSLLGQSYLSRITGVTMTGDEMVLH